MEKNIRQRGNNATFWLNILFLFVAFAFIKGAVMKQEGYHWVIEMLSGNMKMVHQYSNLTIAQRSEIKIGSTYAYYKYIKDNTPKDAVIYLPGRDAFFPKDVKSPFTGDPFNKLWATRFLYPRKIVIPSEMGHSAYSGKLTHVAIVNGIGFEILSYVVPEHFSCGVLPVNMNLLKQMK